MRTHGNERIGVDKPIGGSPHPDARRAEFEGEALRHLDALHAFALELAGVHEDAEDLVSDTIQRALERWEQKYHPGTSMRVWLFTILNHLFMRKRRSDAHEVRAPEDSNGRSAFEAVGDVDPEGRFYDALGDEEIAVAIAQLPAESRSAVLLSNLQGLAYTEVAEVLGVPEGTMKSRLFGGRRVLQNRLIGYSVAKGYIRLPAVAGGRGRPDRGR